MAQPWPASLPDIQYPAPDSGYVRAPRSGLLVSPMEVGPPKRRRRTTATVTDVRITIDMTQAQVEALMQFHDVDLAGGSLPFSWIDHLDRSPADYLFRSPPSIAPIAAGWWRVTLDLEMLP